MTNIIQPSRRSFITGLTSLIVAPAIVKVENIMPVKAIEFNELLTIDEITKEARRILNYHTSDAIQYGVMFTKQQLINGKFKIKNIPLTEIYENKI